MIRVVSYNIRKAVGLDWRRDPHRIADVLAEIGADIVVLQEADKRLGQRPGVLPLDRLQAELGYTLATRDPSGPSHGWHGNAILYRASLSPPRTERLALPANEPRGAVATHFQPEGFGVIGVHLALTAAMRRRQVAALLSHVCDSGHPTVIAGDFNHWRGTLPIGACHLVTPGPSFHSSRPMAALDRFILCGPITGQASYVHRSPAANRASDHLPVVLDFELPGESA